MTLEEMKKELEANGYLVKKLRDYSQKKLEERSASIRKAIYDYVKNNGGHYGLAVNWVNGRVKVYGYKSYKDIPDEKWPEIEKVLLEDGKEYIDTCLKTGEKHRIRKKFNA